MPRSRISLARKDRFHASLSTLAFAAALGLLTFASTASRLDAATSEISDRSDSPLPGAAALPLILSTEDAERYDRIFTLQEAGDWDEAEREIARLDDPILMGHLLAQRYLHPTAYRSKFAELSAWLDLYNDHPEARRIHRLALRRMPEGTRAPEKPVQYAFGLKDVEQAPPQETSQLIPRKKRSGSENRRVRDLEAEIRSRIKRGWPTGATEILKGGEYRGLVSDAEFDLTRTDIAWSYFVHGKDELALKMASTSAERSGPLILKARWTAGLAAWRLGEVEAARVHFEALSHSANGSPALISAGAYWAARANLAAHRPDRVNPHLAIAAEYRRSFYGLLANRALGFEPEYSWETPPLTGEALDELMKIPGVVRALALAEAGWSERAEMELRQLTPQATPTILPGLLALADRLNLPATALGAAKKLEEIDGLSYDGALYPLPDWRPEAGYSLDRALVFGIMRKESKFIATARSQRGARGVMQLMPATASSMAKRIGLQGISRHHLFDPELNIALGQEYLRLLLEQDLVGGNLFYMAAAYNSGPAKLSRWLDEVDFNGDPLLFIESVPSPETRLFIEEVLTNLWIYRLRLGQAAPSLDSVASGGWPLYIPMDSQIHMVSHAGD